MAATDVATPKNKGTKVKSESTSASVVKTADARVAKAYLNTYFTRSTKKQKATEEEKNCVKEVQETYEAAKQCGEADSFALAFAASRAAKTSPG